MDLFTIKTFAVQKQTIAETLNFINSGHERVCLVFYGSRMNNNFRLPSSLQT